MCISDMKRKDDLTVGRSLEQIDDECSRLRRELERLRNERVQLKKSRCNDIELMEHEYRNAKEKLKRKLPEHANLATYRQSLRYCHPGDSHSNGFVTPSSNYIIRQQTSLLSAMHRLFCVLPHQIEIYEGEHEREIYPYFRKEIQDLHLDCQEMTNDWMSRLSDQAEENDALYDSYRTELESIETEVRRHRRLLFQETSTKCSVKNIQDGCDDCSILSETDHSSDSEEETVSQGKEGFGFLTEALLLFSASPKKNIRTPSKKDSISDSLREHFCKGGAVFQIAASSFLLPLTTKSD